MSFLKYPHNRRSWAWVCLFLCREERCMGFKSGTHSCSFPLVLSVYTNASGCSLPTFLGDHEVIGDWAQDDPTFIVWHVRIPGLHKVTFLEVCPAGAEPTCFVYGCHWQPGVSVMPSVHQSQSLVAGHSVDVSEAGAFLLWQLWSNNTPQGNGISVS